MPAREGEKRGNRIPLPAGHWWVPLAQRAALAFAKERKIRLPGWREIFREVTDLGVVTSEDAVRRCIEDGKVMWELADSISKVLRIPPPAAIFTSPEAAIAWEGAGAASEDGTTSCEWRALGREMKKHAYPVLTQRSDRDHA